MNDKLLQGQVERLLPAILAADAAAKAAADHAKALRQELAGLFPEPGTVTTAWGRVTLQNGAKRIILGDLAKARIKLIEQEALVSGEASIKQDAPKLVIRPA